MHQLSRILFILIALPIIGTCGFRFLENLSWLDAAYMAFITLSTIGYEVVRPLSDPGKIFVIVYIIFGFSFFIYSLSKLGEISMNGDLKRLMEHRRMDRHIEKLKNHTIVCGFGRMGRAVARELADAGKEFVLIETDGDRVQEARALGWMCIQGDASSDNILRLAGVEKAACLASVLPNDADNLLTVMSARLLQKELFLVARSSADEAVAKLKRAGANRIVSPYSAGANRMAQMLMKPQLQDFYEVLSGKELEVDMTIITVEAGAPAIGKTVKELRPGEGGLVLAGLKRKIGKMDLPPSDEMAIEVDDTLLVLGRGQQLVRLLEQTRRS